MNLVHDITHNREWVAEANCKNMDTNLFFPKDGENYSAFVREVCFSCPVIEECTWYANETSAVYGLFGGMTPHEREAWRRNNKVILGKTKAEWENGR